ncbi:MAG: DUF2764 family protein [Paludibacteraceae bacterium]|nr:DUF2764 family protein [Paludibacteraceae bacterium]
MLYHCLLVGLQDLSQDTKQRLTPEELETEIREHLTKADLAAFEMLLMKSDDERITELLEQNEDLRAESVLREEDLRAQLMYQEGMKAKNAFVRDWFAFNLNLNNILAAVICRKHGFDLKKNIVGEGEVQDALRTSNAKDFGLSATLPEIDDILRLSEVEDLYEREKKTDALRWAWLEDKTLFRYYEAENVFAYWLESQMLHRWDILNKEEGTRIFRELIADMKRDIKFTNNK